MPPMLKIENASLLCGPVQICEQFAWCKPYCQSDDTIQNYSDIFELRFMWCRYNSDNISVEETGREGEQEMLG